MIKRRGAEGVQYVMDRLKVAGIKAVQRADNQIGYDINCEGTFTIEVKTASRKIDVRNNQRYDFKLQNPDGADFLLLLCLGSFTRESARKRCQRYIEKSALLEKPRGVTFFSLYTGERKTNKNTYIIFDGDEAIDLIIKAIQHKEKVKKWEL